jgi:hypothetical protein
MGRAYNFHDKEFTMMIELHAIRQLGFVVPDVRVAAEAWTSSTGAGPFFVMSDVGFADWQFHGAAQDMKLDIAFGQSGDVMIELIAPRGPWPNVYGEAPPQTGTNIPHHHGYLVADLDAAGRTLNGARPVVTAALGTASLRYYDMRKTLGVFVETIIDNEESRGFFALSRTAALDWDGSSARLRTLEGRSLS